MAQYMDDEKQADRPAGYWHDWAYDSPVPTVDYDWEADLRPINPESQLGEERIRAYILRRGEAVPVLFRWKVPGSAASKPGTIQEFVESLYLYDIMLKYDNMCFKLFLPQFTPQMCNKLLHICGVNLL